MSKTNYDKRCAALSILATPGIEVSAEDADELYRCRDAIEQLRARVAELEDECNDRHDLLVEHRSQTTALQARVTELESDAARLDWLADPNNNIGNVQLPTRCVLDNIGSLRAAIDAAMAMSASENEASTDA